MIAAIAQFELVHIHPFVDGNGRTSRLLSTLGRYRSGYDFQRPFTISEFYDRDRTAFYRAIQSLREQGMDLTVWLELFTHGLATQLQETIDRGRPAIKTDLVRIEHHLNPRQMNPRQMNPRQIAATTDLQKNASLEIEQLEMGAPESVVARCKGIFKV